MVSVVNEAVESQAFSMRAVATVGGHLPLRVNSGESVWLCGWLFWLIIFSAAFETEGELIPRPDEIKGFISLRRLYEHERLHLLRAFWIDVSGQLETLHTSEITAVDKRSVSHFGLALLVQVKH